jgi:hypothetical protein
VTSICERIWDEATRLCLTYGMRRGPTHLVLGVKELVELRKEVAQDRRFSWSERMPNTFYAGPREFRLVAVPVPSCFQTAWDAADADPLNQLLPFWREVRREPPDPIRDIWEGRLDVCL